MEALIILVNRITLFDCLIFAAVIVNCICYLKLKKYVNKIYNHFNHMDRISNLPEKNLKRLERNTEEKKKLSKEDLLDLRTKMNRMYAVFSNLTTMFPLFGMLGTVMALIPMVNTIGTTDTSNFFSALTSTAWGIIAAVGFKMADATVSYKIDENEKHTEHLLFDE